MQEATLPQTPPSTPGRGVSDTPLVQACGDLHESTLRECRVDRAVVFRLQACSHHIRLGQSL
jgi:hypothetical protein